jgi:hypothetical protein
MMRKSRIRSSMCSASNGRRINAGAANRRRTGAGGRRSAKASAARHVRRDDVLSDQRLAGAGREGQQEPLHRGIERVRPSVEQSSCGGQSDITGGQLRLSRCQRMVFAEPAQRARRLHAAVAALPPHRLHRSTERRNIMQPPQSPAVPEAITPQLGQPVSARCDSTVNRSPAATLLLRSHQAGPRRARRAC